MGFGPFGYLIRLEGLLCSSITTTTTTTTLTAAALPSSLTTSTLSATLTAAASSATLATSALATAMLQAHAFATSAERLPLKKAQQRIREAGLLVDGVLLRDPKHQVLPGVEIITDASGVELEVYTEAEA